MNVTNLLSNGSGNGRRIAADPDGQIHCWLRARNEELWHGRLLEPLSAHVADDADDRVPVHFRPGRSRAEPPADRILSAHEPVDELLIDDRHRLVLLSVRKETASPERNCHRLKE